MLKVIQNQKFRIRNEDSMLTGDTPGAIMSLGYNQTVFSVLLGCNHVIVSVAMVTGVTRVKPGVDVSLQWPSQVVMPYSRLIQACSNMPV